MGDYSTAALVFFGAVVHRLRLDAGLTQQQVGDRLNYSVAAVGFIEQGRRIATEPYVSALDGVLGARGLLEAAIPMLEAERVARQGPLRVDDEVRRHVAALAAWAFSQPVP
ncbi:helix-turn-helix domain-containing protein [Wenjunlia tyrosinilytica]|jgi:transcriptional regulator with XRE-family HTH domain|uniref:HTH cro/C1-type domain-containing protein n=1 Tax=Wenjunlia tyrosinilytica TaxID=1544741 RepID=A0A917ZQ76_9ACTN|nr:helix-turn-helix transcriptional regulator [Wenjunlia tyrosinilytica]GGO88588.1 hypothetical protein GCM10012280_29770 [Wenjunlia tyrosinilytica]